MEAVSDTFGPELIFTILDIYVQLLLFLYVMIWDTVVRAVFKNNPYPYISGATELSIIIGKFIYLCYRCDSSVKEVIEKNLKIILLSEIQRFVFYFQNQSKKYDEFY